MCSDVSHSSLQSSQLGKTADDIPQLSILLLVEATLSFLATRPEMITQTTLLKQILAYLLIYIAS